MDREPRTAADLLASFIRDWAPSDDMAGAEYADFVAELHAIERAAKDEAARAASEQVAALREALAPNVIFVASDGHKSIKHRSDKERLDAALAILASPAPSPAPAFRPRFPHSGVHLPDENTGDTLLSETCPACRELAANDPNRTGYVNGVPMFWTGEPDPAPSPAREPLDPHLLAQAMHATPWHQHGSYEDDDDTAHDIAEAYARLSDNP